MNRQRCQKFLITGNPRNLSESRNFPVKNPIKGGYHSGGGGGLVCILRRIDERIMLIIMIVRYFRLFIDHNCRILLISEDFVHRTPIWPHTYIWNFSFGKWSCTDRWKWPKTLKILLCIISMLLVSNRPVFCRGKWWQMS